MNKIAKFFRFRELNTDFKTEIIAGVTTFATLAYIMIVIPQILSTVGIPADVALVSTVCMTFIGCMLMGFVANRPFAVAPLLAENVFLVYTIVPMFGENQWQAAFGAVFVSAVILFLLTIFNIRIWLVNSIPSCIKYAFTAGLGFYLAGIGLKGINGLGIIKVTNDSLSIGNFTDIHTLLTITGVVILLILSARGVKISMLAGIVIITLLALAFGITTVPENIMSFPPSLSPVFLKADVTSVLNIKAIPVIFIILVLMFVDTMGTLIGVSSKSGLLNKKGNLPGIKRPMLCDSASTLIGSSICAITSGVYLESTSGIVAGGKSGLTVVVTGILFLSGLFFAPLFQMIPLEACHAVLIMIGIMMLSVIKFINFDDMTESIPAVITIFLMAFSLNIGVAVASGFVLYPVLKICTGKKHELNTPVWILFAASCIFFALYRF